MSALPVSAVDAISPALKHARAQLFPFRWGQWARLALLGLATGEMSSSGGCNAPSNFRIPVRPEGSSRHLAGSSLPHFDPHALGAIIFWIALLALAAAVLVLLMIFVSSVCRFILFESVLERHCALRRGWHRWQPQGRSYFGFQLLLLLAMIAGLALLAGGAAAVGFGTGWLRHPSEHVLPLVLGGILLVLLFAAFMISMAVIAVLTKDFVVPQMALEDVGVAEGWRRLRIMMRREEVRYAGYVGMKILLALAAAVIFGIAIVLVFLVLLIPGIIVGIVVALAVKSMGLVWSAATIALAVTLGLVAVLLLVFLAAFISAPVTVFFPAYSMHFFAGRYSPLAARLHPEPPVPPPEPAPA